MSPELPSPIPLAVMHMAGGRNRNIKLVPFTLASKNPNLSRIRVFR